MNYVHTEYSLKECLKHSIFAVVTDRNSKSIRYFRHYINFNSKIIDNKITLIIALGGSKPIYELLNKYKKWMFGTISLNIGILIFDNSFMKNPLVYVSPANKNVYEKIHYKRSMEIDFLIDTFKSQSWVDKLILVGFSESAVAVARCAREDINARITFNWSCSNNYFVRKHRTSIESTKLLSLMNLYDPYFGINSKFNDSADQTPFEDTIGNTNHSVVLLPYDDHISSLKIEGIIATRNFISSI